MRGDRTLPVTGGRQPGRARAQCERGVRIGCDAAAMRLASSQAGHSLSPMLLRYTKDGWEAMP